MKSKLLFLLGLLTVSFSVRSQTLSFTTNKVTLTQGDSVTFTNTSTGFPSGQQYAWRFGDDCNTTPEFNFYGCEEYTTGTASTKIHTYTQAGTFTAELMYVPAGGGFSVAVYSTAITVDARACTASAPPTCQLVTNRDFEEDTDPTQPLEFYSLIDEKACPWTAPANHSGTPDLFNISNTNGLLDVPNNIFGNQAAQSGNGYAGIIACDFRTPNICTPVYNYREYLQIKLPTALLQGVTYTVSFYVSLADKSARASKIGAYLSSSSSFGTYVQSPFASCSTPLSIGPIKGITPQFESGIITDKTNWTLLSFTVVGAGQNHLTIGYFNDESNTNTSNVSGGTGAGANKAYYYVDNVSVTPECCYDPVASSPWANLNNGTATNLITLNSGSNNISNRNIYLSGTFTVDQTIFLTNCTIYMAPGARINISSNRVFDLTSTTIRAGGCEMWDQIYIPNSTASLVLKTSTVRDAVNAVVSDGGGVYNIDFSTLRENYKSVVVNTTGTHSGIFTRNTIDCPTPPLLFPYNNTPSNTGIEITGVSSINIGSTGSATDNVIDGVYYGVRSNQSNVNIYNTTFSNILNNGLPNTTGRAVWATGVSTSTLYTLNLGSGTIAGTGNTFTNCTEGVRVDTRNNFYAFNNTLTNCNYGFRVFDCQSSTITIGNSTYPNAINLSSTRAISIEQMHGSTVNVAYNTISSGLTTGNEASQGIYLSLCNSPAGNVNVTYNTIWRAKTGIYATGVYGPNFNIKNNIINFNLTNINVGGQRNGIYVINGSSGVNIELNKISRNATAALPTSTNVANMRGIAIEAFSSANIVNNGTRRLGTGINFKGAATATAVYCNTSVDNYTAINFDAVSSFPATMGSSSSPQHNTYVNCIIGMQSTGGFSCNWYHNNVTPFTPGTPPSGFTYTSTANTRSCSFIYARQAGGAITATVNLDSLYNNLPTHEQFIINYDYYRQTYEDLRLALADSAWKAENDTLLAQNVANSLEGIFSYYSSGLHTFSDANLACSLGDVNTAIELTTGTAPVLYEEQLRKTVMDIYYNTWALHNFSLSQADSTTLLDIALIAASTSPVAVHTARAMLGLEVEDDANYAKIATNNYLNPAGSGSYLYPNPANGNVWLNIETATADKYVLDLYDLQGRKLYSTMQYGNGARLQFDLPANVSGIMLATITQNNTLLSKEKLVIIK